MDPSAFYPLSQCAWHEGQFFDIILFDMAFEPTREGQMTEKNLGFGYWWVTHKLQVRSWFAIFLAVVAVPLLGYGTYGFADWYFGSGVAERAAMAQLSYELTDYASFREKNAPRDLKVEAPLVLAAGEKNYDMVARIQNPNPLWWAEVEYKFEAGAVSPTGRAFVMPGESKLIGAFGVKSDSRPALSKLTVVKVNWNRVDQHETRPDYQSWSNSRLGIQIADTKFVPPTADDAVQIYRATFTVTNATAFGYRKAAFFVALQSGSRIVAVSRVTLSDLRAGEKREAAASWFFAPTSVTKIDVKPEVNIFDVQSYISPGT